MSTVSLADLVREIRGDATDDVATAYAEGTPAYRRRIDAAAAAQGISPEAYVDNIDHRREAEAVAAASSERISAMVTRVRNG